MYINTRSGVEGRYRPTVLGSLSAVLLLLLELELLTELIAEELTAAELTAAELIAAELIAGPVPWSGVEGT